MTNDSHNKERSQCLKWANTSMGLGGTSILTIHPSQSLHSTWATTIWGHLHLYVCGNVTLPYQGYWIFPLGHVTLSMHYTKIRYRYRYRLDIDTDIDTDTD